MVLDAGKLVSIWSCIVFPYQPSCTGRIWQPMGAIAKWTRYVACSRGRVWGQRSIIRGGSRQAIGRSRETVVGRSFILANVEITKTPDTAISSKRFWINCVQNKYHAVCHLMHGKRFPVVDDILWIGLSRLYQQSVSSHLYMTLPWKAAGSSSNSKVIYIALYCNECLV